MGKTLLGAHIRRRKPRRALPCKRFCSCCGEDRIRPRLKSRSDLPKKPEARKREAVFGKTSRGYKRASVEVKQFKNVKSFKLSQGFTSVTAQLKQVVINVTRLSEDVLKVLSENGSICACDVSTNGARKLSPSKSGKSSCLVAPTRRLRSTPVTPFVRENFMDRLRELNADWRITPYPLTVNPYVSSGASQNAQEREFSMKTLFLENLSICKKSSGDESAKENVQALQDVNRVNPISRDPRQQLRKMPLPSPTKARIVQFPLKVKSKPALNFKSRRQLVNTAAGQSTPCYVGYRSLLGKPDSKEVENVKKRKAHQNYQSVNPKHTLNPRIQPPQISPLPPAPLTRETVATVQGFPRKPLKHPQPSLSKNQISAINSSSKKKKGPDYNNVPMKGTPASFPPPTQKPQQSSSQKSQEKPKILIEKLDMMQSAHKRSYGRCASKNVPSTSGFNSATDNRKPRVGRRKQSLKSQTDCSDIGLSEAEAENTSKRLLWESSRGTSVAAHSSCSKNSNTPEMEDSCSSPKKQKIAPKISECSKPIVLPHPLKQDKSSIPPPKKYGGNDRIHTIVLSDSSEDEHIIKKAVPPKRSAAKNESAKRQYTPIRSSIRKKSKGEAASKPIVTKRTSSKRSSISNGNANLSKTPIASNRITETRTTLQKFTVYNRYSRNVGRLKVNDSESEEFNLSDSDEDAPRYVSRTGRSIGVSTGCRSCPGCNINGPRKENPKLKPPRKKIQPEPQLHRPDEDSNFLDSDPYTDVVHAASGEPVEDLYPMLGSPLTAVIQGLTSSEPSADEEVLGMLTDTRTAVVVVADDDSLPGSEVEEDVSRVLNVCSPVSGVHGPLAKTISKEPGHTGLNADRPERCSSAVLVNNEIVSDRSPCSPIPVDSKHPETQTLRTDMEDQEVDGLQNLPRSPSNVLCYLSHHDPSGRLLLDEINSESSENGDIPSESAEPEPQCNEELKDAVLADDSSEMSDSSSALVNFDFHVYTECESSCSSPASSMPENSSQRVDAPPEEQVSNFVPTDRNVDSPSLGDNLQLRSPVILPERSQALSEDSKLSRGTLKSPNRGPSRNLDKDNADATQERRLAAGSKTFQEDLASEHEPVSKNITDACSETQDCHIIEPSLDIPISGDIQTPQIEVMSKVCTSERGDPVDLDCLNTNNCQDSIKCLGVSAYQVKAPICEGKSSPLEVCPSTQEVSKLFTESKEGSSSVHNPSLQNDGRRKVDELQASQDGDLGLVTQDGSLTKVSDEVTTANNLSSQDDSASSLDTVICDTQPSLRGSSPFIPEVLNIVLDSMGESACKPGTVLQNETSEINSAHEDCQMLDGTHKVLEIHMLEGCPSCQDEVKPAKTLSAREGHCSQGSLAMDPDCPDPSAIDLAPPECSESPGDSAQCGVAQAEGEHFYHAVSNLLIDCLNNMVETVKLDNREVIIKKVDPKLSYDALETNSAAEEASLAAEDFASMLRELNLPVLLNPRLTIKKLPSIPREENLTCEMNSASYCSTSQGSGSDDCAPKDHQVPENSCTNLNTTPTKSLYERKGYPSPIKRLDARVLSVIKYNDLEIYNDEPPLYDPPESDRVECVSSKGVRLELNPEELANIENFPNTKVSQARDEDIKCSKHGEAALASFEIDELVIYNDEPPLNCTPLKTLKTTQPIPDNEDPEELVIDNDAPPLNEPVDDGPLLNELSGDNDAPPLNEPVDDALPLNESSGADSDRKPSPNDPECMIISSDDELLATSGPKEISAFEETPDIPNKHLARPCKKLFRKRRNSKNTVEAPSIIDLQKSQMALRGADPHDYFGSTNQQILDFSDDIIDEVVVDDSCLETVHQPSLKPLPSFQSCREVLHQPQVFSRQGQHLLELDSFGNFSNPNSAIANSSTDPTSSNENVCSTSQVTFDLSETFTDSRVAESKNISDSDTLTASECGDEVIVVSPQKTSSSSNVNRFIDDMYKNGCVTKEVVHKVDSDSDDDVILLSGPDDVRPVINRVQNIQSPSVPSPVHRTDLRARNRLGFMQPTMSPRIQRNLPLPLQFTTGQLSSIRTASGNNYYVLVVPPNTR